MKLIIETKNNNFLSILNETSKFYADVFTHDDENYHIIMKGVNYKFQGIDQIANINHCISKYEEKGAGFVKDFRGSFAGALLDKRKNKWIVFTNHFGDQQLFYAQTDDSIIISSSIFEVNDLLKSKAITSDLDVQSAYQLLSYGYLVGDRTLIKNIKKIEPGHYLEIENSKIQKRVYFKIDNTPNLSLTKQDCIENIDNLFKKAVALEFAKDNDYGLRHFATLSGGLDSRMTVWAAYEAGYENITCVTFSQHEYLDTKIAHQIASNLNIKWMTVALDGGNHLIDRIDDLIFRSNALYHYAGASALMGVDNFSLDEYGLIHTGMLGDVVIGTYTPQNAYESPSNVKSASKKLLFKTGNEFSEYANNEIATFYMRGCNGILINNSVLQMKSDVASPFLDLDFFEFSMSIPIELRANHKIYKQWLLQKYPKAADIIWESINARISDKHLVIRNKIVPLQHLLKFFIQGLYHNFGKNTISPFSKKSMNPFNYWLKTNDRLDGYLNNYLYEHLDLLSNMELKKDSDELFRNGNAVEKMQVLTLLSAVKLFKLNS